MEEKDTQVIEEAVKELKEVDEEKLKETIEKWFSSTRTDGMRIGAFYISEAVNFAIKKNLGKPGKASMNDYKRCIKDILKIIEVQIKTKQNDSEEEADDGTAAESSESNS